MLIRTSQCAFEAFHQLSRSEVEEFWVLALFSNKRLIGRERVFRGTVDSCAVYQRDIFRLACRLNASAIIIGHNHPSGDPTPSDSDIYVTKQTLTNAMNLGIELCDHLIVTERSFWSFADHGFCFSETKGDHLAADGSA